MNASSRILGPGNFRGKRPKLGSAHAQGGSCFIEDAPEGEGTDVAVERSGLCSGTVPRSWCLVRVSLGAAQHYG